MKLEAFVCGLWKVEKDKAERKLFNLKKKSYLQSLFEMKRYSSSGCSTLWFSNVAVVEEMNISVYFLYDYLWFYRKVPAL